MKTAVQLKALIRNLSVDKKVDAGVILRNFMQERFLERVSVSRYKDNFILKGGMLIASMVGIDSRATMDMDVTIKGRNLSEAEVAAIVGDILNAPVDDNVMLAMRGIEEIREESDYPGYRVSVETVFQKTRQMLKIDITTGDFVTPKEIEYHFRLMFEDRAIGIMAYNLETILAEKFETVVTRGVTNTRMRDFYDIYILMQTQAFDYDIFRLALKKTAEIRNSIEQINAPGAVIQAVSASVALRDLWRRYQNKYRYAAGVTWEMAIEALRNLDK